MSSATPLLEIKQLSKSFEQRRVVDVSHLSVAEGEFFSLLGSSGCGKSTILRLIAGFESADTGQILSLGRDITHTPVRLRDMNMVFQNYALFPHLNVFDNVAFGLRMQKKSSQMVREEVHAALRLVQMLDLSQRFPHQLSGGQQQRVALARAVAPRPSLLLLDEPLGALDLKLRQDMQTELKQLQRSLGITFIFVTHDQDEAMTMSDRIAIMSRGQVLQVGTPQEIYEQPESFEVASFLGEANFIWLSLERDEQGKLFGTCPATGLRCEVANGSALASAQEARAMIRPEHLLVTPVKQQASSSLPGESIKMRIESVQYRGRDCNLRLKGAGDGSLSANCEPQPAFQVGCEVLISLRSPAVRAFL